MAPSLWDTWQNEGAQHPIAPRKWNWIELRDLMSEKHRGDAADNAPSEEELAPYLANPIVVDITNVAEYMHGDADQRDWDLVRDFPNVAPPWPHFWTEYRMPRAVFESERTKGTGLTPPTRVGAHHMASRASDEGDDGWEISTTFIVEHHGDLITLPWRTNWSVDSDGSFGVTWRPVSGDVKPDVYVGLGEEEGYASGPNIQHHKYDPTVPGDVIDGFDRFVLHPTFLALSFSHCKNVELVMQEPPPKLVAKHAKRGRQYTGSNVLVIEPMTRKVTEAGKSAPGGHKASRGIAIVRGHFADYRERGLFGKHRGVFWFDQHARGRGERRDKTYEVRPPKQENDG